MAKLETKQMKHIYILAIILLYAASAMGQESTPTAMSLKQAIEFAEKNNPTYLNVQTDKALAGETVKQVQAIGLPQLNGAAGFQQFLQVPGQWIKNFVGPSPEYIFLKFQQPVVANASITLSQLIFDGSYLLGLKAAKEYLKVSNLMELKSRIDLHTNVAKAYLLALTTAHNLNLINSNLKTLEQSLADVTVLNREGFAEKLDVQRLQLAVSNLQVQRQKIENAIVITQNLLKLQMGMDVNTPLVLTDELESVGAQIPFAADGLNINDRTEAKLLNQSLTLSVMEERRWKLAYMPSLVGFVQYQQSTMRPEFNFFQSNLPDNNNWIPSSVIGLNLKVPIFDGFSTRSKIAEVRLKRIKTVNDLKYFTNVANMEFSNARANYEVNLKQVEEQKKNLELAKLIYEKANLKYKEGVGSAFEITQAQNDLNSSQTNYLNALYDLVISKIDLKHASGADLLN